VKHDGTFDSFAKALDLCDGLDRPKADSKVLLKPNVVWGAKIKGHIRIGYGLFHYQETATVWSEIPSEIRSSTTTGSQ
jgi:hypothetical protein